MLTDKLEIDEVKRLYNAGKVKFSPYGFDNEYFAIFRAIYNKSNQSYHFLTVDKF